MIGFRMIFKQWLTRISETWQAMELKFLRLLASLGTFEDPLSCDHEWHVVSTTVSDVSLLLECYKCCSYGVVDDPSELEWSEAFSAPEQSYRWHDNSRVRLGKKIEL